MRYPLWTIQINFRLLFLFHHAQFLLIFDQNLLYLLHGSLQKGVFKKVRCIHCKSYTLETTGYSYETSSRDSPSSSEQGGNSRFCLTEQPNPVQVANIKLITQKEKKLLPRITIPHSKPNHNNYD